MIARAMFVGTVALGLAAANLLLADDHLTAFYGDGSAGVLVIDVDTDWSKNPPVSTNFQFSRVLVGASWTIPSGLTIKALGDFEIGSSGSLTVVQPPNTQESFYGSNLGVTLRSADIFNGGGIGVGALQASQILSPGFFGGSPGYGAPQCLNASGGGTLSLRVGGKLRVDGNIVARGGDGTTCSVYPTAFPNWLEGYGGGGGGFIVAAVQGGLSGTGTIDVSGGNGGSGQDDLSNPTQPVYGANGSGGGGGVFHVISPQEPTIAKFVSNGGKVGTGAATGAKTSVGFPGGASGGSGGGVIVGTYATNGYIRETDGAPGYIIFTQAPTPATLFQ